MRSAVAASVGPLVRVDGFRGVVCAAFPSSVYVAPVEGPMLVLHDPAHGATPTSVHVDRAALAGICVGEPAAGRAGHLRVGHLVVDIRQARVWVPPPPCRYPAPALPPDLGRADAVLVAAVSEVLAGCRAGATGSTLRTLVGRGPGLTPAGDDALVGLLAVLHRAAPPRIADTLLHGIGTALPPLLARTNEISAHYLRLALAGHFAEPLLRVVDDVAATGEIAPSHLQTLLRTGATSGADALAGVAATAGWFLRPDLKDVA